MKSFVIFLHHFVIVDCLAVDSVDDLTKVFGVRLDEDTVFFNKLIDFEFMFMFRVV